MEERFCLTREESLRLKRHLDRLEALLFHDNQSLLNLFMARKGLYEISLPLSRISKTRERIEEILNFTKDYPMDRTRGEQIIRLISDLRVSGRLDEIELKSKQFSEAEALKNNVQA